MSDKYDLSKICKALGNPIRLKIVNHLKRIDRCVCGEVVNILPIAQSTVSQHLKVLKDAGLISGKVSGPSTCYCINKEALKKFKNMVKEF